MELGPHGITVNAILPGSVKGARMNAVLAEKANSSGSSIERMREQEVENTSMRCMIDPKEIADLAWYLCSIGARKISGQSIGVCGNLKHLDKDTK